MLVIRRHSGFLSAEHDVDLWTVLAVNLVRLLVNRSTADVVLTGGVECLRWK